MLILNIDYSRQDEGVPMPWLLGRLRQDAKAGSLRPIRVIHGNPVPEKEKNKNVNKQQQNVLKNTHFRPTGPEQHIICNDYILS